MEKQKFNKPNRLAEEALMELRQRITEITLIDVEIEEDMLRVFQVDGEPNWGEILNPSPSNRAYESA